MSSSSTKVRLLAAAALAAAVGTTAVVAYAAGSDGHRSASAAWVSTTSGHQVLGGSVRAGVPTVERFRHGGLEVTVTVAPARPGPNLVRLDTAMAAEHGAGQDAEHAGMDHGSMAGSSPRDVALSVGTDRDHLRPARERAGTDGRWAVVDLPAGHSTLYVSPDAGTRIALPIEAGHRAATADLDGPDGPECLAAVTGRILAGDDGPVTACPAGALDADDRSAVALETRTLLGRGVRQIAVLGDDSPRSRAAADVVRALAARRGAAVVTAATEPGDRNALLVLGGWRTAARALTADSRMPLRQRPIRSDGTWLAPWLLTPRVVDSTSGVVLPLGFDTRDAGPLAYRAALQRWLPEQAPTGSGYRAWRRQAGRTDGAPHLYAASRDAFMSPGDMGMSDAEGMSHEQRIAWFPGGTITPVEGTQP